MSHRLLAYFLFVFAACALGGMLAAAVLAARSRDRSMAVVAIVIGLAVAALLANAGADLW